MFRLGDEAARISYILLRLSVHGIRDAAEIWAGARFHEYDRTRVVVNAFRRAGTHAANRSRHAAIRNGAARESAATPSQCDVIVKVFARISKWQPI